MKSRKLQGFQKLSALLLVLALVLMGSAFPTHTQAASNGFYINGSKLYDANGNEFVMRGINVAHTWFKDQTDVSLRGVANTGANTVRIVLSNGAVWNKDSLYDINRIIQMCKDNKLIAVLEVHDATGSDNRYDLERAVDYWIEMKSALIGNEKYVILNIANEWGGSWDSWNWRDGYVNAIPRLREAGIRNTLMVDCAGWGQFPQSIVDGGWDVFSSDPLRNTMFSIHMYEYAGGDAHTVRYNIDSVLNRGLPVLIGEFAGYHTNGDVDEYAIMSYCQERSVGYLGWSWKGNNDDLNYLDISQTFEGGPYTEWGNTLVYYDYGIRATSRICTVYR